MRELSEQAMENPATVTDGELDRLVGTAVAEVESLATRGLAAVIAEDPDRLETVTAGLLDRLEPDRPEEDIRDALRLGADLGGRHPTRATALLPAAFEFVDHESALVSDAAVQALVRVGPANPSTVADHRDAVGSLLDDDRVRYREVGAKLAAALAGDRPEAALALLEDLVAAVGTEYESVVTDAGSDDGGTAAVGSRHPGRPRELLEHDRAQRNRQFAARKHAALAVADLARSRPEAVADHAGTLAGIVEGTDHRELRYHLAGALVPVAETTPEAAIDALDPLVGSLAPEVRDRSLARVTRALSFLADADRERVAGAVGPRLTVVLDLLESEQEGTESAALGLLLYVAERYPDEVAEATGTLVSLLEAGDPSIRAEAAWVLGDVGGPDTQDRLETVAASDPVEEVRAAADRAVEQLDEG